MILRPVRPQSPTGPPMTNLPVGLMWYWVDSESHSAGITTSMISRRTMRRSSSWSISGACWVDSTTASTPHGMPASS